MEQNRFNSHEINLKENHIVDVDDVIETSGNKQQQTSDRHPGVRSDKLKHALDVSDQTQKDILEISVGLNNRITELGEVAASAYNYTGEEKIYAFFGKFSKAAEMKAKQLRHERIQHLSFAEATKEIGEYVMLGIKRLGEREAELNEGNAIFERDINNIMQKEAEANPLYLAIVPKRQKLEAEVKDLEELLHGGTLEEAELPGKTQEYETKKRELDAMSAEEQRLLTVLKRAREDLATVQKSRDAYVETIKALHNMRQELFEKFSNLGNILKKAADAIRTNSTMAMYESVDQSFNAAIEKITANNIAMAGGAVDVWLTRAKQAAIDPTKAQEFANQMVEIFGNAAKGLDEIENSARKNTKGYVNGSIAN